MRILRRRLINTRHASTSGTGKGSGGKANLINSNRSSATPSSIVGPAGVTGNSTNRSSVISRRRAAEASAYARHRDTVRSIVQRFHRLSISQRQRAMARVLQSSSRTINEEIDRFFKEADKDKDGVLSSHEFRAFLTSRFSLKSFRADPENHSKDRPTNDQLKLVMIASAIPFVGFGFVDNIIMLAAGDMIEDYFHDSYHISILCAAALGNTVSDVIGLSLGGIIETFARKMGIPDPKLSREQANMAITHWANFFASAGGITIGCLLGMFPLLFMSHKDEDDDDDDTKKKKKCTCMLQDHQLHVGDIAAMTQVAA
jgi:hypothetical protein